jgi:hypothetical protein
MPLCISTLRFRSSTWRRCATLRPHPPSTFTIRLRAPYARNLPPPPSLSPPPCYLSTLSLCARIRPSYKSFRHCSTPALPLSSSISITSTAYVKSSEAAKCLHRAPADFEPCSATASSSRRCKNVAMFSCGVCKKVGLKPDITQVNQFSVLKLTSSSAHCSEWLHQASPPSSCSQVYSEYPFCHSQHPPCPGCHAHSIRLYCSSWFWATTMVIITISNCCSQSAVVRCFSFPIYSSKPESLHIAFGRRQRWTRLCHAFERQEEEENEPRSCRFIIFRIFFECYRRNHVHFAFISYSPF